MVFLKQILVFLFPFSQVCLNSCIYVCVHFFFSHPSSFLLFTPFSFFVCVHFFFFPFPPAPSHVKPLKNIRSCRKSVTKVPCKGSLSSPKWMNFQKISKRPMEIFRKFIHFGEDRLPNPTR